MYEQIPGDAASDGGVGRVSGEVPPAVGDRGDELAVETSAEDGPLTGERLGESASCGGVESVGMEPPTGGSGGKSPNFRRMSSKNGLEAGGIESPFYDSPGGGNDRRLRAGHHAGFPLPRRLTFYRNVKSNKISINKST